MAHTRSLAAVRAQTSGLTFLAVVAATFLLVTLQAPGPLVTSGSPQIPIKHLVYIIQENHSFDNYFGTYPGANGIPAGTTIPADPNSTTTLAAAPFHMNGTLPISIVGDELPPGVSDPEELSSATTSTSPFHLPSQVQVSVNSAWSAAHMAYDNGKMDGFVFAQNYYHLNGTLAVG